MEQETQFVDIQRLERINRGFNFENFVEEKKFIKVMLDVEQDLREKTEVIKIETNLIDLESRWEVSLERFLKELKIYCLKPLAKITRINRKNTLSFWGSLRGLRDGIRKNTLKFSDIEITIGKLAKKKIKFDFKERVNEILKLQKKANKTTQILVDRFVRLNEKVLTLKVLIGKTQDDYGYCYNKPKDRTIKIELSPIEFNEELKKVDLELREIGKKLKISIDDFNYDYKKIEKEVNYSDWLKTNKEDLEENFKEYGETFDGDEDENDYKDFDDFCEKMFDRTGNTIEVEWAGKPPKFVDKFDDDEDDEDEDDDFY